MQLKATKKLHRALVPVSDHTIPTVHPVGSLFEMEDSIAKSFMSIEAIEDVYKAGEKFDASEDVAASLIDRGLAEEVTTAKSAHASTESK